MPDEIASAVMEKVEQLRKLYIDEGLHSWEAATHGTPENLEAAARCRAELMRFWADENAFKQYRIWDETNAAGGDKLLARQIRLLQYAFAQGQRDSVTIDQMNRLMQQIDDIYVNFRGKIDGKPLNNNAIEKILQDERDVEIRQEAWEASKQIGPLVAPAIRQLARLRNLTATRLGFANYHRMSLQLDEIDPDWLYAMLDDLAARTEGPFREVKAELDAELSKLYNVPIEDLRPWHYSDMFFQEAPKAGTVDLDHYFADQKLEDLALKTYDGLGMDVRDVLARSDLYEREGKNQHAFCTDIDREGDIRTLCNLRPDRYWLDTLLHELGHAVYDKYIPRELPWLLRSYPHTLSTEAMALLMGSLLFDRDWLTEVRGLPPREVDGITSATRKYERLKELIFARWVMVMVNFERALYEDPDRDLDTLWWNLVEKYQLLHRPDGRSMPDWATKYHVALAPAYYQNYLIGRIVAVQWRRWLDDSVGGLVNRSKAGEFFRDRVFSLGATLHWNDALEHATGEKLNIQYYVDKYVKQPVP
jgi:peptidyl-dipeptidase A